MPFCRSEGIFPGRLIEESLEFTACVVSDGIAVNGLALIQCSFQSRRKGSRSGRIGIARLRAAFFPLCLRGLRNYLNPVHLEIRKSVCCVNPSLAAYFTVPIWYLCLIFMISAEINGKFTANYNENK